jgi:drug/metabolite transporter (DMT)-like permease
MFAGTLICFQSAYVFYKTFAIVSGGNQRMAPAFMAFWNCMLGVLLTAAAVATGEPLLSTFSSAVGFLPPSVPVDTATTAVAGATAAADIGAGVAAAATAAAGVAGGAGLRLSAATLIAAPIGGLSFAIAGVLSIKVMSTGPFVWTVLTMNLSNFLPVLFALIFLGESISAPQTAGVLLILSILFFMNIGLKGDDRPFTPKWMALAIISMLANGAILCTQKAQSHFSGGGETLSFLSMMFLCGSLFAFIYYMLIKTRGEKIPFRAIMPPAFGLVGGIGIGNVISMSLMRRVSAAIQFPIIVGGGVVLSAILSVVLYKERSGWRLYLNAALLIAGVILLGL